MKDLLSGLPRRHWNVVAQHLWRLSPSEWMGEEDCGPKMAAEIWKHFHPEPNSEPPKPDVWFLLLQVERLCERAREAIRHESENP